MINKNAPRDIGVSRDTISCRRYSVNNIYYVYQLIDPRNNKPFYIGEGKGKRAWSHLNFTSGCNNPHKDRIIQKIHSLGLEVIVQIIEKDLTKNQSRTIEEKLIEQIGLENLSNICSNANPPILTGERNGFYGKTHTLETKKILGNINRGKDLKSKEGKESIRQSLIERWNDPSYREKQILALSNRKGETRSEAAKESYRKSAAERDAKMSPEKRSERSKKGAETRKLKYAGMKRKLYIDDFGRKRFKYIPCTD
jgi:hypothetical protein